MATWRRHHNVRFGRQRTSRRTELPQDITDILNGDANEGFKIVLYKIYENNITEDVLLNYLNALVKLTLREDFVFGQVGYSVGEVLSCLRILLTHESTRIRSGGMRCIRHVLKSEEDVITMNKLLIPFLITRCLDLLLKYEAERIEAMKLVRKTLILAPNHFDMSMARNLVSLANEGSEGKDRMLRICLGTLSEMGVLNAKLFIQSGGVAAITRNLLECQTPKIAESLCGVLLLLLDRPETRDYARIDLHSVAAPFCDFHYKHVWKENRRDERELRLNCSRLALLTILRSWPGILCFCSPEDNIGFKAIVDVLRLNQLEVRKSVLDLLYELLGLPQPEWTDELAVALSAVDPCEPQASWRLNEGFVAAEGRAVLPHLAKTSPSTTDIHLSLLLYCFLENGLLGALTEVIATSDTFISVRATVLLGELLRLIQLLLPPGCCNISPSLPALIEYATKSRPQAIGAITALQQFHKLMKRRPASYSLHLDYILRSSSIRAASIKNESRPKHRHNLPWKTKFYQFFKNVEDTVKQTGVLSSNDASTWNWNLISILLKNESKDNIDIGESTHRSFIKRLIEFFMPSKKKYSHMDLGTSKSCWDCTNTGIELVDYLANFKDEEYNLMVLELFKDILENVLMITTAKNVHDCLFSPQHMLNTQCQSYFLFIGRFAATAVGIRMLDSINMFEKLEALATTTNHDHYVKLIISSMDYSSPGPGRRILAAVLTCPIENSRLYATQFLLVLLRANLTDFPKWGIPLLVKQLNDEARAVYLSALNSLHEACEMHDCLDTLIQLNPTLDHLGERGMYLQIRFLSSDAGLTKLNVGDFVVTLIRKWVDYFNYRYVKLVETDLSDALTLHQRNEMGKYDKRSSSTRMMNKKEAFLPPHLYGQLCQHPEGFKMLLDHGGIDEMMKLIKSNNVSTDDEIMHLKSAIWSIGHLGASHQGLDLLKAHEMLDLFVFLCENSAIYSIRATAFYALSLSATTRPGADELFRLGWVCTRHNRHEYWPVLTDDLTNEIPNDNQTLLSDDASLWNSQIYDFDNFEVDDELSCLKSPSTVRVRQSTLPMRRPPLIIHKRSMSESKTFDIDGFDEWGNRTNRRLRNSSFTESTTSGVSSCESHGGATASKPKVGDPLSPIQSSSSFCTLLMENMPMSNTSQRISTNSTSSDVSLSSSSGRKLSYLRSFRNFIKSENSSAEDFKRDSNFLTSPRSNCHDPSTSIRSFNSGMFTVQKFPISKSIDKDDEKCYMGICLPQKLVQLFPTPPTKLSYDNESDFQLTDLSIHNAENCINCIPVRVTDTFTDTRLEVIKNLESLSNPVSSKHVRYLLLLIKQKEPEIFKDLCIYSQASTMIRDSSYRLSSRRFIQELFLDVSFKKLREEPKRIVDEVKRRQS